MRILHTADWHVGRTLHGAALLADQIDALYGVVELAIAERADVIVVAGDLYDRSAPAADAMAALGQVIETIVVRTGIPIVAIAGNHDGPDRIDFLRGPLRRANIHFAGRPTSEPQLVTLEDEHGPVSFCLLPYIEPGTARALFADDTITSHDAALRRLAAEARQAVPPGTRSVAIAHAFVKGGTPAGSERTLAVGGAEQVGADAFDGFTYTALGHLHREQAVTDRVRYSGSPYPYSFDEAGHDKGALLVELGRDGVEQVRKLSLRVPRSVSRLKGTFDELVAAAKGDPRREHWLEIELTDAAVVPDAKLRLQEHYPNVLSLRTRTFDGFGAPGTEGSGADRDDPLLLFEPFVRHLTGEEASEDDRAIFAEILARALTDEREEVAA